jgi:hypothetical protein
LCSIVWQIGYLSAPAQGACPAVVTSTWSGIPGDATDGTVLNHPLHNANIQL